ncbi:MAG: sulfurtransferase TusA family protein [Tannerellaceae bacterium]|jgi:sulfite reductase (ferredoxin)|nr:sulfurtransferase TusA family protein [Tannerellaceae bacterium]
MYKLPETLGEDIAKLGNLAKGYQEGKIEVVQFKAFRVPMGIYEQRKNEVYMSRIRATGGVITPKQLMEVVDIALAHRSGLLHITTRQEIQIQNLALPEIEPLLYDLQKVGLSTKGGGGNTVRNILVSQGSGIFEETFDTTPYALALTTCLVAEADSYLLPRKLKIAFSSQEQAPDYALINDLGFVARIQDGRKGFRVYVGGGGGSNPAVGHLLFDFIADDEVFAVATALKRMFSEHGNRKNKHKARLRYIFERLGVEPTLSLIRSYYEEAKKKVSPLAIPADYDDVPAASAYVPASGQPFPAPTEVWTRRYVTAQRQEGYYAVLLPFLHGNIAIGDPLIAERFKKLLRFVAQFGPYALRFTTTQNILLRHIPGPALAELYALIQDLAPESDAPPVANNLVSCTGADTCRLGICLSKGLTAALRRELLRSDLDTDKLSTLRIHVSGCPNSCGQQLWADIGFSGKVLRNERAYPAYQLLLAAGRTENNPHLALPTGNIGAKDVPAFVVRLLAAYSEQDSASFAQWLEQGGHALALALLKEYEEIPSFEEDKNYYYDWGAEELFSLANRGAAECSAGLFDMIDVDLAYIRQGKQALDTATDNGQANGYLYDILFSASRMLLVTRGADPRTPGEVFDFFLQHFIDSSLIDARFRTVVELGKVGKAADFLPWRIAILALADDVTELYAHMDDSLQFKSGGTVAAVVAAPETRRFKDLRGIVCPMNFVQTKIQLAAMQIGEELEVWLDDGHPIGNVPGSVRNEGHEVLAQTQFPEGHWKVVIRKR